MKRVFLKRCAAILLALAAVLSVIVWAARIPQVDIASPSGKYFKRLTAEASSEPDAHCTVQAYVVNTDLDRSTGYMYTYGQMSGAWYGSECPVSIELEHVVTIGMAAGETRRTAQRDSSYGTRVYRINIPEEVMTVTSMDGDRIEWIEHEVRAVFVMPDGKRHSAVSAVRFEYDL